jgi:hypothetical protein
MRAVAALTKGTNPRPQSKARRQGFYGPYIDEYAKSIVIRCSQCQLMGDIPRKASTHLQPLTSPWPFVMWGLYIIGPMPVGSKQCKFLLVAIDYLG